MTLDMRTMCHLIHLMLVHPDRVGSRQPCQLSRTTLIPHSIYSMPLALLAAKDDILSFLPWV